MFAMFLFSVPTAVGFSIRDAKAVVVVMGVFLYKYKTFMSKLSLCYMQ